MSMRAAISVSDFGRWGGSGAKAAISLAALGLPSCSPAVSERSAMVVPVWPGASARTATVVPVSAGVPVAVVVGRRATR